MKKIVFGILILFLLVNVTSAQAHKLITHDNSHRDFESALFIPDHKISWAIYDDLGTDEAKYYTFDAKKGDSFYASIVIPKITGLEEFSPTMVVTDSDMMFREKVIFEGNYPSKEFYEPFGQVTYWERQEVNFEIPNDGKYFIIILDEKNQKGKYSLAVETIEDFSILDFFTILPTAWIQTKLFVNDFNAIIIFSVIIISILSIPTIVYKIKKQKLVQTN